MFLKDYSFNPQCPPEVLEKAREFLLSHKISVPTSGSLRQNMLYAAIYSEEGESHVGEKIPCHAIIGHPTVKNRVCVATLLYCAPQADAWNDWFINRSFASYFILNKETAIEDGGIVISADIPAPLVQFICIASRAWILYYTRDSVIHWKRLVDMGLSEEAAYYFTCNFTVDKEFVTCIDHTPWSHSQIGVAGLNNLCNHDFGSFLDSFGTRTYRTDHNFMGTPRFCVDGPPPDNIFSELFNKDVEYRARICASRKETPSEIVNPFLRKTNARNGTPSFTLTVDEFFNVAVPYFVEKNMFTRTTE